MHKKVHIVIFLGLLTVRIYNNTMYNSSIMYNVVTFHYIMYPVAGFYFRLVQNVVI